jgi:NSS family neurotransmitter:Na+ symporter
MDALGQLFYSLSIAMGILIAYGSYMRDDTDLTKATKHIDFFDTFVALLAAIMIVPAVYVFQGKEGMQASGPGLIFVTLPVVFQQMGAIGTVIGSMFFALVLFAALTSSVSILEAVVSSFTDRFHMKRTSAILLEGVICLAMGTVVCLGYNVFMFDIVLPNGAHAQILDILDFISNNLMMPVISIGTCILVGWIMDPRVIIEEMTKNGESFKPKGIFLAMIRFVAPAFLVLLLLKATGLI